MKHFCLIGYPLEHSFSPLIHNLAFGKLGIDADYHLKEIEPVSFEKTLIDMKQETVSGFNITIPYKQDIIPYLDEIDPISKDIGAINTVLKNEKGDWTGYNTDYIGFLKPLEAKKSDIKRCLIIGAGGAARGAAFGLLSQFSIPEIDLVNRTPQRASQLAEQLHKRFDYRGAVYSFSDFIRIDAKYDLIVQTTSVGMSPATGEIPLDPVKYAYKSTIVYDLIYNPVQTCFLQNALEAGLRIINGWSMLVHQAEAACRIWCDKTYNDEIIRQLNDTYRKIFSTKN